MEHPGFLGLTSQGVIAIHADWPAYPREHGWEVALLAFGDFPLGTAFRCIDNIDQCALFLALGSGGEKDPYDESALHIAVWHQDLMELDRMSLIAGIEFDSESNLTARQRQLRQVLGPDLFDDFRSGRRKLGSSVDGEWVPIAFPEDDDLYLDDDDDDEFSFGIRRTADRMLLFNGTEVRLTGSADAKLAVISRAFLEVPPSIQHRVLPMLRQGLFDSCVRELGAALETRMKQALPPSVEPRFGLRLVTQYIEVLRESDQFISSRLKTLNQELRTAVKFVRNEFSHNLVDLPTGRGYTLVARMCWNLTVVEQANRVLSGADS